MRGTVTDCFQIAVGDDEIDPSVANRLLARSGHMVRE